MDCWRLTDAERMAVAMAVCAEVRWVDVTTGLWLTVGAVDIATREPYIREIADYEVADVLRDLQARTGA